MTNKIILLASSGTPDKSVDGRGGIQRGNFYVNNVLIENATLVNGIVYDSNGDYVGPKDP